MWARCKQYLSGQGGNRTPERRRRADLQSASFGPLDTCPIDRCAANKFQCSSAEPTARVELATLRLQGGCSATELRRRMSRIDTLRGRHLLARCPDIILTSSRLVKVLIYTPVRKRIVPAIVWLVKAPEIVAGTWRSPASSPAWGEVGGSTPLAPAKQALRISSR
jgi:hypothetical protein